MTKSTFSYQKAQKPKVAQNYAKQILVGSILCFAYIFSELGVFLSKTVSQVQFTKTIAFLWLSWLQANFHDIKHPFHNKKHFFIPKRAKNKSCSKSCKTIFDRTNLCFAYIFGELGVFLSKTVSQVQFTKKNSILETFMISSKFSWHQAPFL